MCRMSLRRSFVMITPATPVKSRPPQPPSSTWPKSHVVASTSQRHLAGLPNLTCNLICNERNEEATGKWTARNSIRLHGLKIIISAFTFSLISNFHRYNINIGVRARGLGAAAPQTRANPLFFGQKLNFLAETSSQKFKKKYLFLYLLKEKTEFILSSEIKCPKSGLFTNNYWVGWVGQSNFAS